MLSVEEFQRLLEAAPNYLRPILLLAHDTGMRRGEILNLRWSQVDLQHGFICLEGADTKTDEGRSVPLNERLTKALKDAMHSAIRPASGPVFHRQGKPIKDIREVFTVACCKAAIADFRFHDLRHSAATGMLRAGAPLTEIGQVLRHSQLASTAIYAKADIQALRALARPCQAVPHEPAAPGAGRLPRGPAVPRLRAGPAGEAAGPVQSPTWKMPGRRP